MPSIGSIDQERAILEIGLVAHNTFCFRPCVPLDEAKRQKDFSVCWFKSSKNIKKLTFSNVGLVLVDGSRRH
jgi:hypothetical protein